SGFKRECRMVYFGDLFSGGPLSESVMARALAYTALRHLRPDNDANTLHNFSLARCRGSNFEIAVPWTTDADRNGPFISLECEYLCFSASDFTIPGRLRLCAIEFFECNPTVREKFTTLSSSRQSA